MSLFELLIVGILVVGLGIITLGFWLMNRAFQHTRDEVKQVQGDTTKLVDELKVEQRELQRSVTEIQTVQAQSQRDVREWRHDAYTLSRALRTTHQQGLWGQLELERIIEFAGMQPYCHFGVQVPSKDKARRADVVVYLHNNRSIVIDAHAPSQAYTDAMEIEDEKERKAKLKAYAKNVKGKMQELADKAYWQDFKPNPELVVLFLPNEAMFRAALEYDSTLLKDAMHEGVLLASPITLIAVLKGIAYGWTQQNLTLNTRKIIAKSKEISADLGQLLVQWQQIREHMYNTHTQFEHMLVLYQQTLLPHLKDLGALENTLTLAEKTMDLEPLPLGSRPAQGTQTDSFSLHSFLLTRVEGARDLLQTLGPFLKTKKQKKSQEREESLKRVPDRT